MSHRPIAFALLVAPLVAASGCRAFGGDYDAGALVLEAADHAWRIQYPEPWELDPAAPASALRFPGATPYTVTSAAGVVTSRIEGLPAGSLIELSVAVTPVAPADLLAQETAAMTARITVDGLPLYRVKTRPQPFTFRSGAVGLETVYTDDVALHRVLAVTLADGRTAEVTMVSTRAIDTDPDATAMLRSFDPAPGT